MKMKYISKMKIVLYKKNKKCSKRRYKKTILYIYKYKKINKKKNNNIKSKMKMKYISKMKKVLYKKKQYNFIK